MVRSAHQKIDGRGGFVIAAADASRQAKESADVVCDGVNDDVQINLMISRLPTTGNVTVTGSDSTTRSNEGGCIQFTEGSFQISAPIDISGRSNITLRGLGPSTVIKNNAVLGEHAIQAINVAVSQQVEDRVFIADMIVIGNTDSGDGIHIEGVEYMHLTNLFVQENGDNGLNFAGDSGAGSPGVESPHVQQCQFLFNGIDGIRISDAHEFFVVNCTSEENLRHGIYSLDGVGQLRIIGCNIEDHSSGDGVHIDNGAVGITGCILEDSINVDSITSVDGLSMTGSSARDVVISSQGSTGAECSLSNVVIHSLSGDFNRLRISNSKIINTGIGTISIYQSAQISSSEIIFQNALICTLQDNSSLAITGCDLDEAGAGVYTFQRSGSNNLRSISFTGNTLDPSCDLVFDGNDATQMMVAFGNNVVRDSTIDFNECDFITLTGNMFYGSEVVLDDCDGGISITGNLTRGTDITLNATCAGYGTISGNTFSVTGALVNNAANVTTQATNVTQP